ncbi:IPT/TIG domain-containing protein [Nocardia tengchongensis]|uniref:IPT/TIG domain-containing protein n=1 Tax=Nocardia tengchongensis TaxID=2055889 RepID=UPI003698C35D
MRQPVITKVSPFHVGNTGGTQVTVTGSGFTGASRVYFQNLNGKEFDVQQFTVNSDTSITLISPATTGRSTHQVFVVVGGVDSTVPQVGAMVSDGNSLSSTGTGGGTWVSVPGRDNEVHTTEEPPSGFIM